MEEKNHSINRTDETTRTPNVREDSQQASTEQGNSGDTGLTPTQLNNIQRSPTQHATTGTQTKPFVTGTDSDGQL